MNHPRRVGTVTLGLFMVIAGAMFLINQFTSFLNYRILLALWPSVLVLLGIEILVYCFFNKEERLRYDGGAIFLIILLSLCTIVMAGVEFFLLNAEAILNNPAGWAGHIII